MHRAARPSLWQEEKVPPKPCTGVPWSNPHSGRAQPGFAPWLLPFPMPGLNLPWGTSRVPRAPVWGTLWCFWGFVPNSWICAGAGGLMGALPLPIPCCLSAAQGFC